MKRSILIFAPAICLLLPQMMSAQGILYFSNLGETSADSRAVASNAWIAGSFYTGNASGGYTLNSIQLLMAGASGSPSNFSVLFYSSVIRAPDSNMGSLSGSDPATGGVFTYTAPALPLSRFTLYFIVVTASSAVAEGAYNWSFANANTYNASDQWSSSGIAYTSSDGLSWTRGDHPFQFAVYATAVPEPSMPALVGLGLVGLSFWRCKHRQNVAHS